MSLVPQRGGRIDAGCPAGEDAEELPRSLGVAVELGIRSIEERILESIGLLSPETTSKQGDVAQARSRRLY